MLVILSKSLEEGKAEVSHAGISDLLEQLKYPFQQRVGLLHHSLIALSFPSIEITIEIIWELVNYNLYVQVVAFLVVGLDLICLKLEQPLTRAFFHFKRLFYILFYIFHSILVSLQLTSIFA